MSIMIIIKISTFSLKLVTYISVILTKTASLHTYAYIHTITHAKQYLIKIQEKRLKE